jgi:hypothetical protein
MHVDWPNETCVTAWVLTALQLRGLSGGDPADLARLLDTRLPDESTPNPWGLAVTDDQGHIGVRPADATRELPGYLHGFDPGLGFRYVPSNTVAMGMHEAMLGEATERRVSIGAGLDVSPFIGRPGLLRHVVAVDAVEHPDVLLHDPVGQVDVPSHLHVDRFVDLIDNASGGYWLIGDVDALRSLRHALPWNLN